MRNASKTLIIWYLTTKINYNLEKIGFLSLVATAIDAFMKSSLCNNI